MQIGVKPPTAAAAAAVGRTGEVNKEPEKMIGRWTASQVQVRDRIDWIDVLDETRNMRIQVCFCCRRR